MANLRHLYSLGGAVAKSDTPGGSRLVVSVNILEKLSKCLRRLNVVCRAVKTRVGTDFHRKIGRQ